jgi:hypothetical protein
MPGLTYEGAREYWTPRRLTLDIRGLNARSSDVREDIKGPTTSAPEQAIQGFLRKAGLASVTEAHVHGPEEGRFLRRPHRQAGPPGRRDHRRGDAGHHPQLSLAEIDALRRRLGKTRCAALGAPAAIDRLHLRFGDGGDARRALRGRRPRRRQCHLRPPLPRAGRDHRAPLRRLCRQSGKGEGRARCRAPQADHRDGRQQYRVRQRPRTGRGRGPAGRGLRPRRMAAGADGHVRGRVPGDPVGNHPPDHQDQPEMFRHPQAGRRDAFQPLHPHRQHRGEGWRQGDRARQRQGRARPPVGRQALLATRPARPAGPRHAEGVGRKVRPRPGKAARPAHGQARRAERHLPCQAGHPGRPRRAHPQARRRTREGIGADPVLVDRAVVLAKADLRTEAVGEFPELQGIMGRKYASCFRARTPRSPRRSRTTGSRRAPPTACLPTRSA